MEKVIKTYNVLVVREQGPDPITGHMYGKAEEHIAIDAINKQVAHRLAQVMTTLKFCGQEMRIFIDGHEHLDERS